MSKPLLYDIIESPAHPDLAWLSDDLGFERLAFNSQRKAISQLKRRPPDAVVVDFFYGYGNNYAGTNVSNLDVLLRSLQRFAPAARTVILVELHEIRHVPRLAELFSLHAVLTLPVAREQLEAALS